MGSNLLVCSSCHGGLRHREGKSELRGAALDKVRYAPQLHYFVLTTLKRTDGLMAAEQGCQC